VHELDKDGKPSEDGRALVRKVAASLPGKVYRLLPPAKDPNALWVNSTLEQFAAAWGKAMADAEPVAPEGVIETSVLDVPDMPSAVLDGWLGDIRRTRMAAFPIAYAWPALVTAASVLVPRSGVRTNLYCALVGEKGTGKSQAYENAFNLVGLQDPTLLKLKSGSAEGLAAKIGDVGGATRLFFTDELEHLLLEAAIEGSTFASFLSSAYYEDLQDLTIARGRLVRFNARLTVAGGVVEEKFDDLFGAATTGGFYDRFVFGQCPTGFRFDYRPFTGGPALQARDLDEPEWVTETERPVAVEIADDVWAVKSRIASELNCAPRLAAPKC
jgi:hypothetical protein